MHDHTSFQHKYSLSINLFPKGWPKCFQFPLKSELTSMRVVQHTHTKAVTSANAWTHSQHTGSRKRIMPTLRPWNEEHDSFPFNAGQSCLNTGLSSDIELWGKILNMTHIQHRSEKNACTKKLWIRCQQWYMFQGTNHGTWQYWPTWRSQCFFYVVQL